MIPSAAVQNGSNGTFVYVVKQDQTVDVRPVTVAVTEGNIASISAGLNAGEQVVTDGQDRLQAGVTVDAHTDARPVPAGGANGAAAGKSANADGVRPQGQRGQGGAGFGANGNGRPGAPDGGKRRDRQDSHDDANGQPGVPKT